MDTVLACLGASVLVGILAGRAGAMWAIRSSDRRRALREERAARPYPGRTWAQDTAAIAAATLDSPCCERWWVSVGAEHHPECRSAPRRRDHGHG
ncbi:hypothetical protein [Streptomyces sp. CAU 1734]|uniref:hypothetical protein n=1 Tax=Streptomyces sp. CAU 1734 TaxID=3140360 RepID=UPI0032602AF5